MSNGNNWGGYREGSGRKPKADELKIIEALSPLEPEARKALERGVKSGEFPFVKLYYEYFWGKPKQKVDVTTNGESINATPDLSKLTEDELKQLNEITSKFGSKG